MLVKEKGRVGSHPDSGLKNTFDTNISCPANHTKQAGAVVFDGRVIGFVTRDGCCWVTYTVGSALCGTYESLHRACGALAARLTECEVGDA